MFAHVAAGLEAIVVDGGARGDEGVAGRVNMRADKRSIDDGRDLRDGGPAALGRWRRRRGGRQALAGTCFQAAIEQRHVIAQAGGVQREARRVAGETWSLP